VMLPYDEYSKSGKVQKGLSHGMETSQSSREWYRVQSLERALYIWKKKKKT
jgi:hypothetical protein